MANKLTTKQENFAKEYVLTGNATASYKKVYNTRPSTKEEHIWVSSCTLLKSPKVALRVEELKAQVAVKVEKKFNLTVDELLEKISTVVSEAQEVMLDAADGREKIAGMGIKLKAFDLVGKYADLTPATKNKHAHATMPNEGAHTNNYDIAREIAFLLSSPDYQNLLPQTKEISHEEYSSDE